MTSTIPSKPSFRGDGLLDVSGDPGTLMKMRAACIRYMGLEFKKSGSIFGAADGGCGVFVCLFVCLFDCLFVCLLCFALLCFALLTESPGLEHRLMWWLYQLFLCLFMFIPIVSQCYHFAPTWSSSQDLTHAHMYPRMLHVPGPPPPPSPMVWSTHTQLVTSTGWYR